MKKACAMQYWWNSFGEWLEHRTGAVSYGKRTWLARVPAVSWSRAWPPAILFAVFIEAVTGLALWMYYSPSAQTAWESVHHIQHRIAGGWLLRAVHHYAAHVLVAMVMLYVLQTILTANYRAPRELSYWLTIVTGLFALAAILTGDLLYWDANGFASTTVRVGFLNLLPLVGDRLYALAVGGTRFGSLTLTRFFALHAGVFGTLTIVCGLLQWWTARRADEHLAVQSFAPLTAWPRQTLRNALACVAVLAVILALALSHGTGEDRGVFLGTPADTVGGFPAARPEWMLVGVYELNHLFAEYVAPGWEVITVFVLPGLMLLAFLAMPLIGRTRGGQRCNVVFTGALVLAIAALTVASWWRDARDPRQQEALAAERAAAARLNELIAAKGVPAEGALAVLRADPLAQGVTLFRAHCASCHTYEDPSGTWKIATEQPSAPRLNGFASREWLAGLLDPKRIASPEYFGNTALKKGGMVNFVNTTVKGFDKDEQAELQSLLAAISAEAQLPAQAALDAQQAPALSKARAFFDDFGCGDCHRFGKQGSGTAPLLTGYGSQAWTAGIISDPTQPQYYGRRNDRMPKFKDILSREEIELLARFLRGDWTRP